MAFYIRTDNGEGEIYQLDAVVSIAYSQTGKVTSYTVEEGFEVSDHYHQSPDRITFSGSISKVKFLRNGAIATDLETFEKGMQTLKRSGKPFACLFSENLDTMKGCRFTKLDMSRSVNTGKYALDVNFTIQPTVYADQAQISAEPIPADQYKDMVETKKGGRGSTEEPEPEKEAYLTTVYNLLTGKGDIP